MFKSPFFAGPARRNGQTFNNPTFTGTRTGVTYPLAQSYVAVATPADVTEDALATITIPGGTLRANDGVRVTLAWSFTNNANAKTLRVRFSGASGTVYLNAGLTTQTPATATVVFGNSGATNAQAGYSEAVIFGNVATASTSTSAVDTTADTTVVISGQKASAGDALTLISYMVEIIRA